MAHPGVVGVMFGKGPSLDTWDLPRRGDDIWVTLNEACKVIQKPDYAYMADTGVTSSLKRDGWHPDPGTIVIGKDMTLKHMNDRDWLEWIASPTGTVLYLHPYPADVIGGSSGACMLSIFKMMGIERVLMVGFDAWSDPGRSSWSAGVNGAVSDPRTKWDYGPTNDSMRQALEFTGLSPVWWHTDEDLVRENWNAGTLAG